MGLLRRIRDGLPWTRPTVQQAAAAPAGMVTTPRPRDVDSLGALPHDAVAGMFQVRVPDPEHIELLWMVSHEVGSTTKRIRDSVWRKPLRIVPNFALKCLGCGHETNSEANLTTSTPLPGGLPQQVCPGCNGPKDNMVRPDEAGQLLLEQWRTSANEEATDLEDLGKQFEDDANKHDNTFAVFRFEYELTPIGTIDKAFLREFRRGDPRYFRVVRGPRGRMGGVWFACLRCRGQPGYVAEAEPRPCSKCQGVTYDAWYVELDGSSGGKSQVVAYYLRSEVVHRTFHYGGTSPLMRVWDKAVALVWMDKFVVYGFDPRRDKRPDRVLVLIGGNADSLEKWVGKDAERRRQNPYALATLHIPINGASAESRPHVEVVDLGDQTLKLQSPELRTGYKEDIWREYGVTPAVAGDMSGSGGLNDESLQLRVHSQVVESHQREHTFWLDALRDAIGVQGWHYEFEESLEEQEQLDLGTVMKGLEVAEKAAGLGLPVTWRDNRPLVGDGEVKKAAPMNPPIGPPAGEGMVRDVLKQTAQVEQADTSRELPKAVQVAFRSASGAPEASDALWTDPFAGLTVEQSEAIKREVLSSLTQPQGWSVDSIIRRIQPVLEEAGVEQPHARAEGIARMETAAVISEFRIRHLTEQAQSRGTRPLYRRVGADDHRTTKQSRWERAAIGPGKPLEECLAILDQAVQLSTQGAFTEGGLHGGVEGVPIRLPPGFRRRGWVTHFSDRDDLVQVPGSGA